VLARLFVLFTTVTLTEVYLLTVLGQWLGVLGTVALVFLTGAVGAWLARREGTRVLRAWQESLARGEMPEDGIVGSLLVLVGGVLLVTPGVLTDAFGLGMMIPPLRRQVAGWVRAYLEKRVESGELKFEMNVGGFAWQGGRGPRVDGVIDTDAEEVEVETVRPRPRLEDRVAGD
jgi:UPF0716 protein FxsA